MYYLGIAVDASRREVRFVALPAHDPTAMPELRMLTYGEDDLPTGMRDLHAAACSTLGELPAVAAAVRRMDPPQPRQAAAVRTATIDRLLAEGAVLAAVRDKTENVEHLTGNEAASRLGFSTRDDALDNAKQFLTGHGLVKKWAEAAMIAQVLV
jgi:hypothetical protein